MSIRDKLTWVFFVMVVAVAVVAIWPGPKPQITIDANLQGPDRDMAAKAAALLVDKCPRLDLYWPDFKETKVEIVPDYWAKNGGKDVSRGWGRTVQVVLGVREGPTRIPPEWRASGHNLFYVIGGGAMPGVEMIKIQSMQVCGMKKDVWAPSKFFLDEDFAFVK